jgi:hypothetical protein
MGRQEEHDGKPEVNDGRRKLIKAAAVAGGAAVAAGALPGEWKKPLATVGGLPAHAQTSEAQILIPDDSLVINTALADSRVTNGIMSPRASFAYIDPLCEIDDTATLWTSVGPCGEVEFNNAQLKAVPAAMKGDACKGFVGFAFHPCGPAGYGSLAVQLSKGQRHSNVVNASFYWGPAV